MVLFNSISFLFLAALGLPCRAWAFSGCGEPGLPSSAVPGAGFSCCGERSLGAPRHTGASQHRPITPCQFPCNTPILPVQKPSGENQFVQDLGAMNGAVIPIHPLVPNPYNLLTQVPWSTQYFCFGPQRCIFLYSPKSRLSIAFGL